MLCSAAALVLAGTSVAQTRRAFTELDFSTIQSPNSNPFGLVYRDAITANEQGKVNIHRITYELDGLKIAANIYTPAGYDASKKLSGPRRGAPQRGMQGAGGRTIQPAYGSTGLHLPCL